MKKVLILFFVLLSVTINAQKISDYVTSGDTVTDVSDSTWMEVSEIGASNATKAIRLKPLFDAPQSQIDINKTQLADSLGWYFITASTYGDGVTDATAHIQARIDEAEHGTVQMPPGQYLINADTLEIHKGIRFIGSGIGLVSRGATELYSTYNKPIISVELDEAGGGEWSFPGGIRDMNVRGGNDADSSAQHGILINKAATGWFKIERCYITDCGGWGVKIGNGNTTHNVLVYDNKISNNYLGGIYGVGSSAVQVNTINVYSNHIDNNKGYGAFLLGSTINFIGNIVEGNDSTGFFSSARVLGEVNASSFNMNVKYNHFEVNGGGNIYIESYFKSAGSVVQYHNGLHVTDNYLYNTSGDVTKPEVTALVEVVRAADSDVINGYKELRVIDNTYVETGLAYFNGGGLDVSCVVDLGNNSNFANDFTNLGDATIIWMGETMAATEGGANITAAGGVTAAMLAPYIRIGIGAPIDITANPQIVDGLDGMVITIIGNGNNLTLDNGNGLFLPSGQCVLGANDLIRLRYNSDTDLWHELGRSEPKWENITVTGTISANILSATGNISGTTESTLDTDPTVSLTTADCRNKARYNNDADVIDYTLPGAAAGLVVIFYDIAGGVITIDPVDGTDTIYLNGTSVGAGDEIDSPGDVGDFIALMAIDATRWITIGRSGTWVDANP